MLPAHRAWRAPATACCLFLTYGVIAHVAITLCMRLLPGNVEDRALWGDASALATGLAWAAVGILVMGRGSRALRLAAHLIGSGLVVVLVFGEARVAVLGVGPRFDDLHFLVNAGDLAPSVTPMLVPVISAALVGLLLWNLGLWLLSRAVPLPWAGAIPLLVAILLAATSMAVGRRSGHALSNLFGGQVNLNVEWLEPPELLTSEDGARVFKQLGLTAPSWPSDAPLCRTQTRRDPSVAAPPRSVIVMVLESLGSEVLERTRDGRPVVPFLHNLSERNATLRRFHAAGTKTAEGFLALFAGVPAVPGTRLTHHRPMARFEAIPGSWAAAGYATAVIMAADPTFEQIDRLMHDIGVQQVLGRQVEDQVAPVGWGVDDQTLLRRARAWIEDHRRLRKQPYVLIINSVGTHHPYSIPSGHARRFHGSGSAVLEDELFASLDTALEEFVTWYDGAERDRGTVLLITGDHVSHLTNARRALRGTPPLFATPLVALNLAPEERSRIVAHRDGDTAHVDLAPTLSHLLGVAPPDCALGVDLLAPGAADGSRLIVGHDTERRTSVILCGGRRFFSAFKGSAYSRPTSEELSRDSSCLWQVTTFFGAYTQLLTSVAGAGAFGYERAPSEIKQQRATQGRETVVASHRGATTGPLPGPRQNRSDRIELVREAGFEWIEVDVSITREGTPVVFHDPMVLVGGRQVPVAEVDLDTLNASAPGGVETFETFLTRVGDINLIVDLKAPRLDERGLNLVYQVAQDLRRVPARRRVIVDSFSSKLATAAARLPDWEVGWDTPFKQPITDRLLHNAQSMGVGWIFIQKEVLSRDVVKRARQHGIRVMVYPISAEDSGSLRGSRPDGAIADTAEAIGWEWRKGMAAPTPEEL